MTNPSSDDFAVLHSCLARRTPEAQVELLSTSLASEARRRGMAELDNALLRNDLAMVTEALDDTKVALLRAEQDRALLCATIVAQVDAFSKPESERGPDNELAVETPARRIFADRAQALVEMADLLRRFQLDHFWSDEGLTLDPSNLRLDQGLLPLSDRVLLLAAHDLLSEEPTLAFIDVVEHLRGDVLEAICALVRSAADPSERATGAERSKQTESSTMIGRAAAEAHHAQR